MSMTICCRQVSAFAAAAVATVMPACSNLHADPLEGLNLAADPEQAGTLAKLRARWEQYTQELK